MDYLISVIIPMYDSEKYINECINSVLNQTYTNFELLLINDGSKDKSLKICREKAKTDKRIKIISLPKNRGVSNARNIGIKIAQGKYIIFVDSDDTISEDFLMKLYKNSKDKILCRGYNFSTKKKYNKNEYLKKLIYGETLGSCCGYLIEKKLCNKIFFDTKTSYMEDTNYIIKIVNIYDKVQEIDGIKYNYRINENSVTNNNTNATKILHNYYYSIDEIHKYIEKNTKIKLNTSKINNRKYRLLINMCHSVNNPDEINTILSDTINVKIFEENNKLGSKIFLTNFGKKILKERIKLKNIWRKLHVKN